jgi:hypothetical protein
MLPPAHPSSKVRMEKKKKKKAVDGKQESETVPERCNETAAAGGGGGGGGGGEEMAKAERKAAKKAAKKTTAASEGEQYGGVLDPLGGGERGGADGAASDAPLAGSGRRDKDDGSWSPVPEIEQCVRVIAN